MRHTDRYAWLKAAILSATGGAAKVTFLEAGEFMSAFVQLGAASAFQPLESEGRTPLAASYGMSIVSRICLNDETQEVKDAVLAGILAKLGVKAAPVVVDFPTVSDLKN